MTTFFRFVALLLVPGLLTDPALALSFSACQPTTKPIVSLVCFKEQALSAASQEFITTLLFVKSIRQTLNKIHRRSNLASISLPRSKTGGKSWPAIMAIMVGMSLPYIQGQNMQDWLRHDDIRDRIRMLHELEDNLHKMDSAPRSIRNEALTGEIIVAKIVEYGPLVSPEAELRRTIQGTNLQRAALLMNAVRNQCLNDLSAFDRAQRSGDQEKAGELKKRIAAFRHFFFDALDGFKKEPRLHAALWNDFRLAEDRYQRLIEHEPLRSLGSLLFFFGVAVSLLGLWLRRPVDWRSLGNAALVMGLLSTLAGIGIISWVTLVLSGPLFNVSHSSRPRRDSLRSAA